MTIADFKLLDELHSKYGHTFTNWDNFIQAVIRKNR